MEYKDFKIRIASVSEDRYRIIVESPMGSTESDLDLPFRLADLEGVLKGVAETVRGAPVMRDLEEASAPVSAPGKETGEFGVGLYRAVFRDTVQSMLDQCLGAVRNVPDTGLRIRLEMDLSSGRMSTVASLPWELMQRDAREMPLSLSKRTTVVRSFDVMKPVDPIPFEPPLRVLVLVSNPGGTATLNLEEEQTRIRATWGALDEVEVTFVKPTIEALLDICATHDFHVIHYMGHGDFDPVTGHGLLYLEKPDGSPDPMDSGRLKAVFQDESDTLRLVFLNACKTAVSTERKGLDPFAGIAAMLIDVGVPAVVAMQFPITDDAAIVFSDTFYRRIAAGLPVDTAVAEGRKALWASGSEHKEWATPVLFMRSRDGVIFVPPSRGTVKVKPIRDAAPPPAAPTPPPTPAPEPAAPRTLMGGAAGGGTLTSRVKWIAGGAAGVLALAAIAFFILVLRTPAFVEEMRVLSVADTVYVAGDAQAPMRVIADGVVYNAASIAGLVPQSVRIFARSDSLVQAEFNDTTGTITVRGRRPGTASFWAVGILPDGDSIVSDTRSIRVVSAPARMLEAVRALDAAGILDESDQSNASVRDGYAGVTGEYAAALAEARRMEDAQRRIAELDSLIAFTDSTDALAGREDLTLGQKLAADSAWLTRAARIRDRGPDYTRIRERMTTLAGTIRGNGSVAWLAVCARIGGDGHCAETASPGTLSSGRLAYATVAYVGAEQFALRWFRDGQAVDAETATAGRNPNGYRVTFRRELEPAGAWEVRVYNRAGMFVARQAFTVQ